MQNDSTHQAQRISLPLTQPWTVARHKLYVIGSVGDTEAKEEDLLQLELNGYILDVGWYSGEEGSYCIYLIRGHFLEGELLEKYRSRDRAAMLQRLVLLIQAVEQGRYDNVNGYAYAEEGPSTIDDMDSFSCLIDGNKGTR